jgi:hypothetical protein
MRALSSATAGICTTMVRSRWVIGTLGLLWLLMPSSDRVAQAGEWAAEPWISVKGEYNSNLLIAPGPNEVWGYWVSPGVKLKGSTERLEVGSTVLADFVQYYGDQNRGFTNLFFPLAAAYRTERDTFGFDGGLTRDNTLMGELKQTGVVLTFTQRNLWTANPTWTRTLTEKLSAQAGYQFADATYENGLQLGLVDYQTQGGTGGLSYQLSERDRLQGTAHYVYFSVPDLSQRSSFYGFQLSATHAFSDTMTGSISAGPRFVTSSQTIGGATLTDHETVWLASASLRKQFDRMTVLLDGSRDINPSGFGLLIETNRVGLTATRELTETLALSVSAQAYYVSAVSTPVLVTPFGDTRFLHVNPKLSWRFSDWWSLDLSYTYSDRQVESLSQFASANATYLMVTHRGYKWSVSR